MRPAAMPAFMAISGVSLAVLVRPRMPSVPKYLRVMGEFLAMACSITNWLTQVNGVWGRLIRLSYVFQHLKTIPQRPGSVRPDHIRALGLGKEFGRQAGPPRFQGRAVDQPAQESLAGDRDQ